MLHRHFDAVYCLSLRRRPDRWKRIERLAERCDLQIQRVISEELDPALADADCRRKLVAPLARAFGLPSTISCSHGHREIWRRVARGDGETALILEDDAVLAPDFSDEGFARIWSALPADWDRVYLGHFDVPAAGRLLGRRPRTCGAHILRPAFPTLAHAYAITRDHARQLLDDCGKIKWYVDYEMALHSMRRDRRVYALRPDQLVQFDHADSEQAVSERSRVLKWALRSKTVEHFYSVRVGRIFSYVFTVGSLLFFCASFLAGLVLGNPGVTWLWSALMVGIHLPDIRKSLAGILNPCVDSVLCAAFYFGGAVVPAFVAKLFGRLSALL
ncbi:MAG: glycosyltransferase family 25 protein [bacterium]|nr:glycosyltransferase family 25 protein [bacterium]